MISKAQVFMFCASVRNLPGTGPEQFQGQVFCRVIFQFNFYSLKLELVAKTFSE